MRDYAQRVERLSAVPSRLFFALWPDSGTRDALAATAGVLRKTCGGRAPPARNLHLTLAFLGNVPAARLPELEDLTAALHAEPFVLDLDRIGWWRQHRLVWAGTAACPSGLEALVAALAGSLRAGGFDFERRRFMPHVTLLRDAGKAPVPTAFGPLTWCPTRFVLACSQPSARGVQYRVMNAWPLKGVSAGL